MKIVKWLEQIICEESKAHCSECQDNINEFEICYTNKNSCLWCEDCARLEQ